MSEQSELAQLAASRIAVVMRTCRLTNRQLAKRSGVDERTIRNVLNGQDAKLTTLEKIAAALHLEVAALVQRAA